MIPNRTLQLLLLIAFVHFRKTECFSHFTEKPSFVVSCKLYVPESQKCLTASMQKLMEQLANGIPEVNEIIGDLEPMKVENIMFQEDSSQVVSLRANFTNTTISGFSKMQVKQSKIIKKNMFWESKIFMPQLRLDADYNLDGNVMVLPISGSGKVNIIMDGADILMQAKTKLYDKEGFTFLNVTDVKVDLRVKHFHIHFGNLFNGVSKELEDSTNQFFNENWQEIFEALKPTINKAVRDILFNVISTVWHMIPMNFFVEDIPTAKEFYKNP